jgi:hypothetical protein
MNNRTKQRSHVLDVLVLLALLPCAFIVANTEGWLLGPYQNMDPEMCLSPLSSVRDSEMLDSRGVPGVRDDAMLNTLNPFGDEGLGHRWANWFRQKETELAVRWNRRMNPLGP